LCRRAFRRALLPRRHDPGRVGGDRAARELEPPFGHRLRALERLQPARRPRVDLGALGDGAQAKRRRAGAEAVVPSLPQFVPPGELPVPAFLKPSALDPKLTGSDALWDNFGVGERIDHPSGMTLEEADHTLATRLYQNNARVHFDEFAMKRSEFG